MLRNDQITKRVVALLSLLSVAIPASAATDASGLEPRFGVTFNAKSVISTINNASLTTTDWTGPESAYVFSMNGLALDLSRCEVKPYTIRKSGGSNLFGSNGGNAIAISLYAKIDTTPNAVVWALETTEGLGRGMAFKTDSTGEGLTLQWNQTALEEAVFTVPFSSEFLSAYHHYLVLLNRDSTISLYVDGEKRWEGLSTRDFTYKAYTTVSYGTRRNSTTSSNMVCDGEVEGSSVIDDFRAYLSTTDTKAMTEDQILKLYGYLIGNAVVEWEDPITISADTDVATEGTRFYAFCAQTDTHIVNGVAFNQMYAWGKSDTWDSSFLFEEGTTRGGSTAEDVETTETFSSEYKSMLSGYRGVDGLSATMLLKRLTPGKYYLVQLFYQNSRAVDENPATRTVTLGVADSVKTLTSNVSGVSGGLGQCIVGRFLAKSDVQRITVNADSQYLDNFHLNALQVREIGASLTWEGNASGATWNSTGLNWSSKTSNDDLWSSASLGYRSIAIVDQKSPNITVDGSVYAQSLQISDSDVLAEEGGPLAGSLIVPEGSSLTLNSGLTVDVQNTPMTISGDIRIPNGTFLKTGNASLSITDHPAATGTFSLMKGNVNISAVSEKAYSLDIGGSSAAHDTYSQRNLNAVTVSVAGSATFNRFSGGGVFSSENEQTFRVGTGETNLFTGVLTGAMGLKKSGEGVLSLIGTNAFSGDLTIDAGTVYLAAPTDIDGIQSDFDASRKDLYVYGEEGDVDPDRNIVGLQSATGVGQLVTNNNTVATAAFTTNIAGFARTALAADRFAMANHASMPAVRTGFYLFIPYGGIDRNSGHIMADESDATSYRWRVVHYSKQYQLRKNGGPSNEDVYQNGRYSTSYSNTDATLLMIPHCWLRDESNRKVNYGRGVASAWGEIVTYTRGLSIDECNAVNAYLMGKWGVNNTTYSCLPRTVNVKMASGTTFDLGGLNQAVASLSGAGEIRNGVLTADLITATNGTLTVSAVANQRYTVASDGSGVLNLVGDQVGTVVISDSEYIKPGKWNALNNVVKAETEPQFILPRNYTVTKNGDTYTISRQTGFIMILR